MEFLKLFFRGISLLPSLVQGVEALYGAKSGAQKKDAALSIVSSSINMADARPASAPLRSPTQRQTHTPDVSARIAPPWHSNPTRPPSLRSTEK